MAEVDTYAVWESFAISGQDPTKKWLKMVAHKDALVAEGVDLLSRCVENEKGESDLNKIEQILCGLRYVSRNKPFPGLLLGQKREKLLKAVLECLRRKRSETIQFYALAIVNNLLVANDLTLRVEELLHVPSFVGEIVSVIESAETERLKCVAIVTLQGIALDDDVRGKLFEMDRVYSTLTKCTRTDVYTLDKDLALKCLLNMAGNEQVSANLTAFRDFPDLLISLSNDADPRIREIVFGIIYNLTVSGKVSSHMVRDQKPLLEILYSAAPDPRSEVAPCP